MVWLPTLVGGSSRMDRICTPTGRRQLEPMTPFFHIRDDLGLSFEQRTICEGGHQSLEEPGRHL